MFPGPPVSEDEVRYLRVPTIPYVEQAEFARTFFQDRLSPVVLEEVFRDGGWFRRLRETVGEADFLAFKAWRQTDVVTRARRWLNDHDLREDKFILPPEHQDRRPASQEAAMGLSLGRDSFEPRLRQRLHQVLEQMTLEEMLELRIPARFSF